MDEQPARERERENRERERERERDPQHVQHVDYMSKGDIWDGEAIAQTGWASARRPLWNWIVYWVSCFQRPLQRIAPVLLGTGWNERHKEDSRSNTIRERPESQLRNTDFRIQLKQHRCFNDKTPPTLIRFGKGSCSFACSADFRYLSVCQSLFLWFYNMVIDIEFSYNISMFEQ